MEKYNFSMIEEENTLAVLKLCSILNKVRVQEQELARARWKVSYYRKIRNAILANKDSSKWKSDPQGLLKKLEGARIYALSVNSDTLEMKKNLRPVVADALAEANAHLIFRDGQTIGVMVGSSCQISAERFDELANEYEATIALNSALSNE